MEKKKNESSPGTFSNLMEEAFKKRLKGFLRQSSLQTFLQLLTSLLN
jgi:hypothetical protein